MPLTWLCCELLPAVAPSLADLGITYLIEQGVTTERTFEDLGPAPFNTPRLRTLSIRLRLRSPRSKLPVALLRFSSLSPITHLFVSIEVERAPMSTALVPYGTIAAPVDPLWGFESVSELLTDVFAHRIDSLLVGERVMPELEELRYAVTMSDAEVGSRWLDADELSTRLSSLSVATGEYERLRARMEERDVKLVSALV